MSVPSEVTRGFARISQAAKEQLRLREASFAQTPDGQVYSSAFKMMLGDLPKVIEYLESDDKDKCGIGICFLLAVLPGNDERRVVRRFVFPVVTHLLERNEVPSQIFLCSSFLLHDYRPLCEFSSVPFREYWVRPDDSTLDLIRRKNGGVVLRPNSDLTSRVSSYLAFCQACQAFAPEKMDAALKASTLSMAMDRRAESLIDMEFVRRVLERPGS